MMQIRFPLGNTSSDGAGLHTEVEYTAKLEQLMRAPLSEISLGYILICPSYMLFFSIVFIILQCRSAFLCLFPFISPPSSPIPSFLNSLKAKVDKNYI